MEIRTEFGLQVRLGKNWVKKYFMPGSENSTAAEQQIINLSNFYYRV